mmetsp:Transcript_12753/g.14358  ORF Transcript_12753/g.14358 Transcript_12753/m.14358 type:complete len:83 (-) Transcript_12753:676-924(-)
MLILAEEFLLNNEIFEFITLTFQALILGFILYKLLKTTIENTSSLKKNITTEVWILRCFYIFIFLLLIVNMVLGILNDNYFN